MTEETPSEDEVIYHEAGHAIMGIVKYGGIEKTSIVPRAARTDELGYTLPKEDRAQNRESEIVVYCAGPVAGARLLGRDIHPTGRNKDGSPKHGEGDEYDFREARTLACDAVGKDEMAAYLSPLFQQTQHLIEKHWRVVKAIAHRLLIDKTLDGDQVKTIMAAKK